MVSSNATRNELVRWAAVDAQVVPLGVDTRRFRCTGELRTHLLHIGSDDPRDLTDVVIAAYERCSQSRPMPPIVVCGNVRHRPPVDSVRWVGRVSDDDLISLLNTAVLCVQPSVHEGFGLQNLEAMSCGAPLLALDVAAVREVAGDCARLLPEASAEDLADAILDLLGDEPARVAMSASGRRRAASYPWANTAQSIVEALVAAGR
jgi:glycosyltransferase involved in cell wall biosynthesis